ncbi:MAG: energy-coupling factor transporter transmembrane component T [Bacillota bacterium]|nr:energy-coupling factor transporter transmembrane component T [Bacillota bacterium]
MLKDITLGQFFPGNSAIHKLDPRAKLILTLLYIVLLFITANYYGFIIAAILLCYVIASSRISFRLIYKSVKPLVFIMIFTGVLNMLYTQGTPIFKIWILTVTYEGLSSAIFMILRLVFLVVGTSMLTYTTSPIMLTDGLERLMNPLKKIHFPAHELSMMMTIALRFIPTLIEETEKIINAQKARGADFETGNIIRRAKALIPVLVPMFISAFRRADELAIAMECRCYHGGEGRTRMKSMQMQGRDFIAFAVMVISFTGVIALNIIL